MEAVIDKKPQEYYQKQINSLVNLPTLPAIGTELLQVTQDDDLSINQLIPIIEKDPPLAMKVLKIANSAYYSIPHKIESLRSAIVLLGMDTLSELALSFSIINEFTYLKKHGSIKWDKYWEHSAACAHIAQLLAKNMGIIKTSTYFTAGLLHDIGKLVLFQLDGELYEKAFNFSQNDIGGCTKGERLFFGIDHSEAGYWISKKWGLPETMIHAIRYHHDPSKLNNDAGAHYASVIQIADLVANFNHMDYGTEFFSSIPQEEPGWKILQQTNGNIAKLDFEHFVLSIQDEVNTIKSIINTVLA